MQNNIIIVQSIIYTILDVLVAEQNSNYHNAEFWTKFSFTLGIVHRGPVRRLETMHCHYHIYHITTTTNLPLYHDFLPWLPTPNLPAPLFNLRMTNPILSCSNGYGCDLPAEAAATAWRDYLSSSSNRRRRQQALYHHHLCCQSQRFINII